MIRRIVSAAIAGVVFALTLSLAAPVRAQPTSRPAVILISIDGLGPDLLGHGRTPTLDRLAAEGASGSMQPSFPTMTFPNHYTLVTGLHPDRHGIINNTMVDAELGRFSLGRAAAVIDHRWWDEGEPIWVSAEQAGLVTATMFWPGSEAAIRGVRPRHWRAFDQSLSSARRVDQVLAWLDLPEAERPRLTTLYFDAVDSAGHRSGPDAAQVFDAAATVDAAIARLISGLDARGLSDKTVLIMVSDHGMAATAPQRMILLDEAIDRAALDIVYSGAFALVNPRAGRAVEVEAALLGRGAHGECWKKGEIPERLAFGSHDRVAAIVCVADVGWLYATKDRPVRRRGGAHGYDNQAPEMQAVFIAHGSGVARGRRIEGLRSIDVQPLLGRLLGIAVPAGDGDPDATLAVTTP